MVINATPGDGGVYWFEPDEDNPGCDGGEADAVVRLPGGELLCAAQAHARGITRPTGGSSAFAPPTGTPAPMAQCPPDSTTPAAAPDGPVYLVAGGDVVVLFDSRVAADIMIVTMVGANLDPVTACLSATRWGEVRAGLLAHAPGVIITDTRTGHAGGTR